MEAFLSPGGRAVCIASYGIVLYGVVWYGTVWYGTVRGGTLFWSPDQRTSGEILGSSLVYVCVFC